MAATVPGDVRTRGPEAASGSRACAPFRSSPHPTRSSFLSTRFSPVGRKDVASGFPRLWDLPRRVSVASAAPESLFFACPKKSNQKKGHPEGRALRASCPPGTRASVGPTRRAIHGPALRSTASMPPLAATPRLVRPPPAATNGAPSKAAGILPAWHVHCRRQSALLALRLQRNECRGKRNERKQLPTASRGPHRFYSFLFPLHSFLDRSKREAASHHIGIHAARVTPRQRAGCPPLFRGPLRPGETATEQPAGTRTWMSACSPPAQDAPLANPGAGSRTGGQDARRAGRLGCPFFGYFLWTSKESNSGAARRTKPRGKAANGEKSRTAPANHAKSASDAGNAP